jgi:hypothetical protein
VEPCLEEGADQRRLAGGEEGILVVLGEGCAANQLADLGFGRIVVSGRVIPNLSVNVIQRG